MINQVKSEKMHGDGSLSNGDNDKREDNKKSSSSRKDNGDRDRGKDVCRDFLNNICNRGSRCKFYHPPEEHEGKAQNAAEEPYQFCIDFQNQGCHRDNCRYIHAFREDVDRYKRTGDVTLGLARSLAALMRGDMINNIPLCKEFQNGHCARGSQCRYWHINKEEERRKRFTGRASGGGGAATSPGIRSFGAYSGPPAGGGGGVRRRADDYPSYDDYGPPSKRGTYGGAPPVMQAPAPATRVIVDMERRNAELVAEVESLKRELLREKERYDDLMALFRATQANQSASMQQRSVQLATPSAVPPVTQQQIQPGIPSLGLAAQQWGTAGSTSNYLGTVNAYDWAPN